MSYYREIAVSGADKLAQNDSLVLSNGFSNASTLHAQCIVHMGYKYLLSNPELVPSFKFGFSEWQRIVEDLGVPANRGVVYQFGDPASADRWVRGAAECGLPPARTNIGSKTPDAVISTFGALDPGRRTQEFWTDELTICPAALLDRLIRGTTNPVQRYDRFLPQKGDVCGVGIEKLNKVSMAMRRKPLLSTDRVSRIVLRGKLSAVSLVSHSFFGLEPVASHRRRGIKAQTAPLSIVSHKLDNGEFVWIIMSPHLGEGARGAANLLSLKQALSEHFHKEPWSDVVWPQKICTFDLPRLPTPNIGLESIVVPNQKESDSLILGQSIDSDGIALYSSPPRLSLCPIVSKYLLAESQVRDFAGEASVMGSAPQPFHENFH